MKSKRYSKGHSIFHYFLAALRHKIYNYTYKSSSYNMVEIKVMYNLNHNLLKMQVVDY